MTELYERSAEFERIKEKAEARIEEERQAFSDDGHESANDGLKTGHWKEGGMMINVETIPQELKDRPQWVCWQEEFRDANPPKFLTIRLREREPTAKTGQLGAPLIKL